MKPILLSMVFITSITASKAAVIYTQGFEGHALTPISTFGWSATSQISSSNIVTDESSGAFANGTNGNSPTPVSVATAKGIGYVFFAPKAAANTATDYNANGVVLFSVSNPVNTALSDMNNITVNTKFDSANSAGFRYAIQMAGQWYVSDATTFSSNESDYTDHTLTLSDWTDGSNWYALDVNLGDDPDGKLDVAPTAVGGTLSGQVTGFGLLGTTDSTGDHIRLSNFSVDAATVAAPEPSTSALFALGGLALVLRRKVK
ncbi:PEP-CTERM sorting domain-containing protein [Persicirhabdus sediminis]|uniref:PEP-CTERM sorting domain-containing protein n=1 Tax=Persicirhabdus sediminis TaxID=454144 RepID=A0A8J7SJH0_9BACT|nr:PEP-CTERM sorting domain-containing protein [Persicirhabdus sediminis]MBK1791111.1 PEP-CTERM sorting domain-containing protein [Persicirhabdus sediminis]